jgi:formate--tetrahydrofolate ligase
MQTLEGQPMLVHAGPFANIAIGQSSVIADKLGSLLTDYLVTESGFAADIGFEKFWNIKCRASGLKPDAVVIVATVRALKLHGGGPAVQAGKPLDPVYTGENLGLLEKGCENLLAHIEIVKRAGVQPVVCLNHFHTDTAAEHALVRKIAEAAGARFAVSSHWLKGGEGAAELAEAVIAACDEPNDFAFLSDLGEPISGRIKAIVREVYGGDDVAFAPEAAAKLAMYEADPATARLPVCMAKTQYSLSHDPKLAGRPTGWVLPVRDILLYQGAGFVVPVAGDIMLMPGTASNPAFRRIDVDTRTGKVRGLF